MEESKKTVQATGQTRGQANSASRRAVLAGAGGVAAWAMMPGKSFAQKIAKPGAGQRVNVAVIGAGGKDVAARVTPGALSIVAPHPPNRLPHQVRYKPVERHPLPVVPRQ